MNFGNCVGLWTLLFAEWSYISYLYQVGFFVSNTDSGCFTQEEETYGEESMEGQAGQRGPQEEQEQDHVPRRGHMELSGVNWTSACFSFLLPLPWFKFLCEELRLEMFTSGSAHEK